MFDQNGFNIGAVQSIVDGKDVGARHTENKLDTQTLHVLHNEVADGCFHLGRFPPLRTNRRGLYRVAPCWGRCTNRGFRLDLPRKALCASPASSIFPLNYGKCAISTHLDHFARRDSHDNHPQV